MDTRAQELLAGFAVVLPVRLHWGEMDAFQHVNNTVYFRYFESSRLLYFERLGATGARLGAVGPILAATSCRYLAPLSFPDTVQVGARAVRLSEDRFTCEHVIVSEKLGRLAARGEAEIVSYDYEAGRKVPLPEVWVRHLRAIEGSVGRQL